MPYADLPSRKLRVWYVINPSERIEYSRFYMASAEPRCAPLDPMKPVVVLVPGLSMSTAWFVNQLADHRLRDAFNLISLDMRFNGNTISTGPETETQFSYEDIGDDIVSFLDFLQLDSYAIFSEGSPASRASIWVTVKRPEKVTCFVAASPGSPDPSNKETSEHMYTIVKWSTENKGGQGDGSGEIPPGALAAMSTYIFGTEERYRLRREEHAAAVNLRYGSRSPESELVGVLQLIAGARDISDELVATIACPVLILQGEADLYASPIEEARKWQKLLTGVPNGGADTRVVAGGPHILSYSEASIVNRIMLSFVNRSVEQHSEGRWRTKDTEYAFGFRCSEITCSA